LLERFYSSITFGTHIAARNDVAAISRAMIAMARSLMFEMIAEGMESED